MEKYSKYDIIKQSKEWRCPLTLKQPITDEAKVIPVKIVCVILELIEMLKYSTCPIK